MKMPVPGFPGVAADAFGNIYQDGVERPQRIMPRWGYRLVTVRVGETRRTMLVHRLVCLAFHGVPPPGKPEVRHVDGDKSNNAIANLMWGSHAENMRDRDQHGTTARGERSGRAILSEVEVVKLRETVASGMTTKEAAAMFGVSQMQASHIATGRAWKTAGGPISRRKHYAKQVNQGRLAAAAILKWEQSR